MKKLMSLILCAGILLTSCASRHPQMMILHEMKTATVPVELVMPTNKGQPRVEAQWTDARIESQVNKPIFISASWPVYPTYANYDLKLNTTANDSELQLAYNEFVPAVGEGSMTKLVILYPKKAGTYWVHYVETNGNKPTNTNNGSLIVISP
jgi:hypothetical protein